MIVQVNNEDCGCISLTGYGRFHFLRFCPQMYVLNLQGRFPRTIIGPSAENLEDILHD